MSLEIVLNEDDCAEMISNSYKNFHCKGLDYLCLTRSPAVTVKAYFFDGDVRQLPEVVSPHNHRYDFLSVVLAGSVENRTYIRSKHGQVYDEFDFYTPLNGGRGFVWRDEATLSLRSAALYQKDGWFAGSNGPNGRYMSGHDEIHTIQIHTPETVLLLMQYADILGEGIPSQTFRLNQPSYKKQKPALDGLYDRMSRGDVEARLRMIQRIIGDDYRILTAI
jgi:hypothetical protein